MKMKSIVTLLARKRRQNTEESMKWTKAAVPREKTKKNLQNVVNL